jgi:UDP-N-acetyl-2-amino-2-deoxyglucuronate dehydrogenase
MDKVKTGIIGCGKVGDLHATALAKLKESQFSAVCDASLDRANKFAEKYGVKAYADIQEMVSDSGVKAAIVCTPHPLHAAPAVKAAQAGLHVLVEKPLASSLKDCDDMINAAKQAKVKLGTMCQRRFYAPSQRVRQAIDQGKIGTPACGTVLMLGWRDQVYYESDPWRGKWKAEGGGVLVNQAPHQLDLLQWFMGPIDELYGVWSNLNHPYIEVEDTALAIIRFKSGALGNIVVSNSQKPGIYGKVHIHGQNGASVGVQTDGGAMFIAGMSSIAEPPVLDLWTVPGEETMLEQWRKEDSEYFNRLADPMKHYHELQIQDFLQAVIKDHQPLITGEEGRKTVEIFTAIYRCQKAKAPVKFPLKPEPEDTDYRTYKYTPMSS